jgi:hypothetical protein
MTKDFVAHSKLDSAETHSTFVIRFQMDRDSDVSFIVIDTLLTKHITQKNAG